MSGDGSYADFTDLLAVLKERGESGIQDDKQIDCLLMRISYPEGRQSDKISIHTLESRSSYGAHHIFELLKSQLIWASESSSTAILQYATIESDLVLLTVKESDKSLRPRSKKQPSSIYAQRALFKIGQSLPKVNGASGFIWGSIVGASTPFVLNSCAAPVYDVCFRERNLGEGYTFLMSEDEVKKLLVDSSVNASSKISKWYRDLRYNRVRQICALIKTEMESFSSNVNRMCRNSSAESVRNYIRTQGGNWKVNTRNKITKKTALREAVESHNYEVIELLVGLGADPNMRDGRDDDHILYAVLRDSSPGAIRTTRLLLSHSETLADPDGRKSSSDEIASSEGKCYWLENSRNALKYKKK
mmetsp:Transcript_50905/g.99603  ORF Transcript_50905/g.99603 Transcript_50905/m.99603 type:complete len:360 (+) Transcript_50905:418-1497(+)